MWVKQLLALGVDGPAGAEELPPDPLGRAVCRRNTPRFQRRACAWGRRPVTRSLCRHLFSIRPAGYPCSSDSSPPFSRKTVRTGSHRQQGPRPGVGQRRERLPGPGGGRRRGLGREGGGGGSDDGAGRLLRVPRCAPSLPPNVVLPSPQSLRRCVLSQSRPLYSRGTEAWAGRELAQSPLAGAGLVPGALLPTTLRNETKSMASPRPGALCWDLPFHLRLSLALAFISYYRVWFY